MDVFALADVQALSSLSVSERFKQFLDNITLSTTQIDDGKTKRGSVCKVLNSKYWSSSSENDNRFYVGSWGKYTRIRPPRDVDVLFKLPKSVYDRFQLRTGNKQSQLLQEIKDALKASFPKTDKACGYEGNNDSVMAGI
jgi:SMODS domain-containing protein